MEAVLDIRPKIKEQFGNTVDYTVQLYHPLQLILCLQCKTAVRPSKRAVESHFRNIHKLRGGILQGVLQYRETLEEEGGLADPRHVKLPDDHTEAIAELDVRQGYSCKQCRYLSINQTNMIRHRTSSKHTVSKGDKGYEETPLQSFTSHAHARWWIVRKRPKEKGGQHSSGLPDRASNKEENQALQAIQRSYADISAEREKLRDIVQGPGGVDVDSRWVKYMGWTEHIQKRSRRLLMECAAKPAVLAKEKTFWDKEKKVANCRLRQLCASFDRTLTRSMKRLERVPKETLKWLRSVEPGKTAARPFSLLHSDHTMGSYKDYWKRYLCYCVRSFALGQEEARREQGIRFTEPQWFDLEEMVVSLEIVAEGVEQGRLKDADEAKEADAEEEEEEDADLKQLDSAVFRFCITSLAQRLLQHEYANPLLHFTAAAAVKDDGGWFTCGNFTRILAGLLWASRILMLEHSFQEDQEEEEEDMEEEEKERIRSAAVKNFHRNRKEWLVCGSYSPISKIIDWMAYGRGFRRQQGGAARIAWEANGQALLFEGDRIDTMGFQRMAQGALKAVDNSMEELTGQSWRRSGGLRDQIHLRGITDCLIYQGPGRSFATNREKNGWLEPGPEKLAKLQLGELMWTKGSKAGQCKQEASRRFLINARQCKQNLLTAMHIWGGQPGRGPEICTLKHCDTDQLPKNIFVFDGQVMFVTDRDKSAAFTGGRKVARFLPAELSKALVAYIAWVLPLEEVLHKLSSAKESSHQLAPWLWKCGRKGVWDTAVLSRGLEKLSCGELGVRLTVESYRHIAVAFGRQIKGIAIRESQMALGEDANEEDDDNQAFDVLTGEARKRERVDYVWDLQATHGSVLAGMHYAVNVMYPGQLQPEMISNFQEVSRLWHEFLKRSDGSFITKRQREVEQDNGRQTRVKGNTTTNDFHHYFQTTRQTKQNKGQNKDKIIFINSGYKMGENSNMQQKKIKRNGNDKECRVATLNSSKNSSDSTRIDYSDNTYVFNDEISGQATFSQKEIDAGLCMLMGKGASWRSKEQQQAAYRVMELGNQDDSSSSSSSSRKSDSKLIVVLPTGGGKSVLFMLPPLLEASRRQEKRINVVVVPFVALVADLVERCEKSGLDCMEWQAGALEEREERQRDARLVVISADVAVSEEFFEYLQVAKGRGVLGRIFMDECHTVMMDGGYRPRLRLLRELDRFRCTVVMLTATLPVVLEDVFKKMMLADLAEIIRAAVSKVNISYKVLEVKGKEKLENKVLEKVEEAEERLRGRQKGVVYCRSVAAANLVAGLLGCESYHSEKEERERKRILKAWCEVGGEEEEEWGEESNDDSTYIGSEGGSSRERESRARSEGKKRDRWVVATTGLGTGVDIESIMTVVHMDQPYGLVDFIQQTGRSGRREGEMVESVVISRNSRGRRLLGAMAGDVEKANKEAMDRFMEETKCRRMAIGQFLEGRGQMCSELKAEKCDLCLEGKEGRSALERERMREDEGMAMIEDWLEELEIGNCSICLYECLMDGICEKHEPRMDHEVWKCGRLDKELMRRWRREVKHEDFIQCYECELPYEWCAMRRIEGKCMLRDKIMGLVVCGMQVRGLREVLEVGFGVGEIMQDEKRYQEWLMRRRMWRGVWMTNGVALWMEGIKKAWEMADIERCRVCKEEEEGRE